MHGTQSHAGEYPYCGLKLCLRRGEQGKANEADTSTRVEPGVIQNIVQKVRHPNHDVAASSEASS